MPALALPLLKYVLAPLVIVGLIWGYLHHIRATAYAEGHNAAVAEMQKATEAEHERRVEVERYMDQWAQGSIARVDELNSQLAAAQARAAQASRAHDKEACWSRDATERLRGMLQ